MVRVLAVHRLRVGSDLADAPHARHLGRGAHEPAALLAPMPEAVMRVEVAVGAGDQVDTSMMLALTRRLMMTEIVRNEIVNGVAYAGGFPLAPNMQALAERSREPVNPSADARRSSWPSTTTWTRP